MIDTDGLPIARAEVFLYRIVKERRSDNYGLEDNYADSERVRCDADGRFELKQVAKAIKFLSASTPGANRITNVDLAVQPDVEELEIVVPRAAHVQIDATASSLDIELVMFIDTVGSAQNSRPGNVWVTFYDGERAVGYGELRLTGRRSAAVAVPLYATQALCYDKNGKEVARIPLHLRAGEFLILKP